MASPNLAPAPACGGTVYGVVLNDQASLQDIGDPTAPPYGAAPRSPVLYIKPANTRVGGGAVIALPPGATEVEVGATIGLVLARPATRLDPSQALPAVGGVVLAADLSLPHASYYRPAIREKCFDGALPMGEPRMLCELSSLALRIAIDGQAVQGWSLDSLVRGPAQLLSEVSAFMTLQAGDVLLLGVRFNAPRARAGSHVLVSADGLGELAFAIGGETR